MTKEAIRRIYLDKRLELSSAEFQKSNELICRNFFAAVDLDKVNVLHTFIPIEKTKEPDTWLIIKQIQKEFPHIQIAVPKINNQTGLMDNFLLEGENQLEKNTWGIPEPKQGVAVANERIDTVIVPLLAVDKKGNRVGYGRGFYDKFLSATPHAFKIGLSFFPPVESIAHDKNDVPIDMIITPAESIKI